mgnify:CR=1 FL=1
MIILDINEVIFNFFIFSFGLFWLGLSIIMLYIIGSELRRNYSYDE